MSKIIAGVKKTIDEVKRLADGTIDDQINACKEFQKLFSGYKLKKEIDVSANPELLGILIKFIDSDNVVLQRDAANFTAHIIFALSHAETTKLINDHGIISKFMKLLSSTDADVVLCALEGIFNIAYNFPAAVVENGALPLIIQCLKAKKKNTIYEAIKLINNISYDGEEYVTAIFEADGIKPLLKILESKDNVACKYVLDALICIIYCNVEICQRLLDYGTLSSMKKLCDRLLVPEKAKRSSVITVKFDESKLKVKKMVKTLAIRFIKDVTAYGKEVQIDMFINEGFIPIILQQIRDGMNTGIKIESIEAIENMVEMKPAFASNLVNNCNIFSLLFGNLHCKNINLIISALNAMRMITKMFDDKEACRQKIQECDGLTKLAKLLEHSNKEIRELAHSINAFINGDVPTVSVNGENELIELNAEAEDAAPAVAVTPQIRRQPKRPTNAEDGPLRKSKVFRLSNEQADTDQSVTPVNDNNYHEFDDHPGNYSPANPRDTVASNDEATGDNFRPTNQSAGILDTVEADDFISDDIVEIDEKKPIISQKSSPPGDDFDNPSRPLSRQSPNLPEVASTNDEEKFTIETKPSPSTRSQPIVIQLPVELIAAYTNNTDAVTTTSDDPSERVTSVLQSSPPLPPLQSTPPLNDVLSSAISFPPVKYWHPYERTIDMYCNLLVIPFDRKTYATFIQKIELTQITSTSEPITFYTPIDQTGFGAFSILLTGNEESSKLIQDKIDKKFINTLDSFDREKINHVINSTIMLEEHFETIAAWLNCRIMIYSYGKWERYGDFESDDDSIPLFVLAKNSIKGNTVYYIVLSLKNDH